MPQLIALTCPICAAPLSPKSDRCDFCGSFIVIKINLPKLDYRSLNQSVIQEHIVDFRRTVRRDPYDEAAHYGLGLAYFNLGLLEDANAELSQAAKLMPENPNIQAQLAVVLRDLARQGDFSARLQMQQRVASALKLDPDNQEALAIQAEIYDFEGRSGEMSQIIQRLIWLNPGMGIASI